MSSRSTATKPGGGSARSWGDSPKAAFAVRSLVVVVPLAIAFAATWMLSQRWEAPTSVIGALARFVALAIAAMIVATAADRVARRFLPLAALLRLSLVFPDQAPSRFAIALRSNNTKKLEQRLADLDSVAFRGDEAEAARVIVELAASLSKHDRLTRGHSERVRAYTALIAEEMGLDDEDSNRLQWAGLIHDVGKLRIPYEILTKPGKLTDREFEIIKAHPAEGMRIAAPLAGFLGEWINAVGQHHERFDGEGYPNGLVGNQISLGGRIVAVADTYDVITAARSYKKPESAAWAREEIARCAGTQFDPEVVRAFLNIGLGEVRRTMWPLSWALQIPFLGSAVTAPIAQTVAASVVTLATATGLAVAGGGFAPITDAPEAIAFVETSPTLNSESTASTIAAGRVLPVGSNDGFDLEPRTQVADSAAFNTSTGTTSTVIADTTSSSTTVAVTATSSSTTSSTTSVPPTTTTADLAAVDPSTTTAAPTTNVVVTSTTKLVTAPLDDCERAQSGATDLGGADLSGCEIGEISLAGADLTYANLEGASFFKTVLHGADLRYSNLTNATFDQVEARRAYFKYLDMSGAEIRSSDMSGSWFYESNMSGVTITDSSMVRTTSNRVDLSDSTLRQVDLSESDLREAKFKGASVDRATFFDSDLRGSTFDHVVVRDSSFSSTDLDGVSFGGAFIIQTDLSHSSANSAPVSFAGAVFENGSMIGVQFAQSRFDGATISGLDMANGGFKGTNFTNAEGRPINHELADLRNAICPSGETADGDRADCWEQTK